MPKQNFETFRGVLRGAICKRTQAQFANESGISVEHLNRMLNADVIYRPSKATLRKIAAVAKNGITYQDLKSALDKDDPKSVSPEDRAEQAAKVAAEFRPEFPDAARGAMEALSEVANSQAYPIIVDSLSDHMDVLVSAVASKSVDFPKISYDLGIDRPYFCKTYSCATRYVRVDLSMADERYVASSDIILYFTEIPCRNGGVKYAIQAASCAVCDIMELFGMPPAALAKYEGNEPKNKNESESDAMERAMGDSFYLDIQEPEYFHEDDYNPGSSSEERLYYALFGKKTRYLTAIEGVGFRLKETPPNLLDFFLEHREAVLSPYLSELENYEDLSNYVDAMAQSRELQPFLDKLDAINYTDSEEKNDCGWPAAIAVVMSHETKFPFVYKKKSDDSSGNFPWLSKHSIIILPDEDAEKLGIQREAVLLAVCNYVQKLGVKRFGDQLFTYIKTAYRRPRSYVVNELSENNNKPNGCRLLSDEDYSVRFEDTPYPEESGLYAVKLKDGRRVELVFLPTVNAWVMRHKEWSDLIESYCPEPLPIEQDAD